MNAVTNLNILPAEGFETDVMKTMFLAGDLNAMMLSGTDPEVGLVQSGDMKPVLLIGTADYPKGRHSEDVPEAKELDHRAITIATSIVKNLLAAGRQAKTRARAVHRHPHPHFGTNP